MQPHPQNSAARNPDCAIGQVDRLSAIFHELGNLLDGSLRCVMLARSTLAGRAPAAQWPQQDEAERQLDVAVGALERMAGLVHAAMQGPGLPLGSALLSETKPVSLAEAIAHAVDVVRPMATTHRVDINVRMAPALEKGPAGPLYAVVLNAVRNAVEADIAAGGGGCIEVNILPAPPPEGSRGRTGLDQRAWLDIEVRDEGGGLDPYVTGERAMEPGFTTKKIGAGLGLCVARAIIEEMGGRIELRNRTDRTGQPRRGAVLRVLAPAPSHTDAAIGRGKA